MRFIDLKRIGYLFGNLPIPVYKAIDEEIQEMIDNNFEKCSPFNNNLAGAIEKEFLLYKSHFIVEEFITEACKTLIHALGWNDAVGKELELTRLWVNFQKKNEYNPIHQHGGHISFVFWHKIPYNAEDERQVANRITSNLDTPGSFSFNYPNHNGKGGIGQNYLSIDKTYEGCYAIFPSDLQHTVYPFYTSDDYRISISGNAKYKDLDYVIKGLD